MLPNRKRNLHQYISTHVLGFLPNFLELKTDNIKCLMGMSFVSFSISGISLLCKIRDGCCEWLPNFNLRAIIFLKVFNKVILNVRFAFIMIIRQKS